MSQAERTESLLTKPARWLLYLGLFSSSFLALRIGQFAVGDFVIGASVVLLALDFKRTRVHPAAQWMPLVVLLVFIAAALAAFRSLSPSNDLTVGLRLVYLAAMLPWAARSLLTTPSRFRHAMTWWAIGAAICAGATIVQREFPSLLPNSTITSAGRLSGLAQSVSDTGGIACVGIVAAIAWLGRRSSIIMNLLGLVAICLGLIGLVLSGSVSGFLATGFGAIYLLLRGGLRLRTAVVLSVIVAVVFTVALSIQSKVQYALSPWQRILQTTGLGGQQQAGLNTTASRLDTMRLGLHGFFLNPLIGSGLDDASGFVVGQLAPHNLLIATAYQGGLLLLLAVLVPVIACCRVLIQRKPLTQWRISSNAVFFTALVFAMTAPSFINRYFWVPVAFSITATVLDRDRAMSTTSQLSRSGLTQTAHTNTNQFCRDGKLPSSAPTVNLE